MRLLGACLVLLVGCVAEDLGDTESAVGSGSSCFGSGSGSAVAAFDDVVPVASDSRYLGLAVDTANTPWLVFLDQDQLRVSHRTGSWITETVDVTNAWGAPSIAAGASPQVVYYA